MSILTRITGYDEVEDPPQSSGTTGGTSEKVEEKKKSEPVSENTGQVSTGSTNVGTGSQQQSTNIVEKQTPVSIMRNSYEEAVKINPNLTPGEWIHQEILRRKESGEPDFSLAEIGGFFGGKDPYKTKAETEAEQKRLKRASMVNALGSLLVSLWNVGRTKAGNPAMNLSGMSERGQARINQMREGQEKIARQNYNDYMDAIIRDKAQRDAIAAEERKAEAAATLEGIKHQNDLDKIAAQQNTPYEQNRADNQFWQAQYNKARAEGYPEKLAAEIASEKALAEQRRAAAEKQRKDTGKGTSGGSGSGGAYHPGTSIYANDGNVYTRSKVVSDDEKKWLVGRYGKPVQAVDKKGNPVFDKDKKPVMKKMTTDEAYEHIIKNGDVPANVLRSMGFIPLEEAKSGSGISSLNWGDEDESNNEETDW